MNVPRDILQELMRFDGKNRYLTAETLRGKPLLLGYMRRHIQLPRLCDAHAAVVLEDAMTRCAAHYREIALAGFEAYRESRDTAVLEDAIHQVAQSVAVVAEVLDKGDIPALKAIAFIRDVREAELLSLLNHPRNKKYYEIRRQRALLWRWKGTNAVAGNEKTYRSDREELYFPRFLEALSNYITVEREAIAEHQAAVACQLKGWCGSAGDIPPSSSHGAALSEDEILEDNSTFFDDYVRRPEMELQFITHLANGVKAIAFVGEAGMGKSILAEYLIQTTYPSKRIPWCHFEPDGVTIGYIGSVSARRLEEADQESVNEMMERMAPSDVIVFDNLESLDQIMQIFPRGFRSSRPTVVLTSRHSGNLAINGLTIVDVYALELSQSIEMISKRLPDIDTQSANKLAGALHGHPIVIEYACSVLAHSVITSDELIDTIATAIGDFAGRVPVSEGGTVRELLMRLLRLIGEQDPLAATILILASFAGPHPINRRFLVDCVAYHLAHKSVQRSITKVHFAQALKILTDYRLVKVAKQDPSRILVHPITQNVIHDLSLHTFPYIFFHFEYAFWINLARAVGYQLETEYLSLDDVSSDFIDRFPGIMARLGFARLGKFGLGSRYSDGRKNFRNLVRQATICSVAFQDEVGRREARAPSDRQVERASGDLHFASQLEAFEWMAYRTLSLKEAVDQFLYISIFYSTHTDLLADNLRVIPDYCIAGNVGAQVGIMRVIGGIEFELKNVLSTPIAEFTQAIATQLRLGQEQTLLDDVRDIIESAN